MIADQNIFHFDLSPAELRWLSGALGILQLPLFDDSFFGSSLSAQQIMIREAQDSLQQRNLIRRVPKQGWQVDRTPAMIAQWLGSAASMLSIDIHTPSASTRHARVFVENETSMHVTVEKDRYHFSLAPSRVTMVDYILEQLGVSLLDMETAGEEYRLPQPITVLRSMWTDATLAAKMLRVARMASMDIRSLLAWGASLNWIVAFHPIQLSVEGSSSQTQAILCGSMRRCWSGYIDVRSDHVVTLSPIEMEAIRSLILNVL